MLFRSLGGRARPSGFTYPVIADGYLKASNTDAGDNFAGAVAASGDTIVVGAQGERSNGSSQGDNSLAYSGAAYVYVRSGATWEQQAYLKPASPVGGLNFGGSVAIDGDTIVIGATGESTGRGAAYVFVRSGTTWTQQAVLTAAVRDAYDLFGLAVAIDGDTIVVGADGEDSNGSAPTNNDLTSSGAAYVFTRSGTSWTQEGYLKASNLGAGDSFGASVGIDGDAVIVGATGESSDGSGPGNDTALNAGAAYIFTRSGTDRKSTRLNSSHT